MSGFQNHLPSGPEGAAERDPLVEADDQALSRIRSMCAVGMLSAEDPAQEDLAQPIRTTVTKSQWLRFGSAKRMSLELAKTVSDACSRDAAIQHIIELCMTADDLETAGILVQGIQSAPIREKLFLRYPALLP
jgi:hypothetical protein